MEIPSLVIRMHERVTDVIDVQLPRAMDGLEVLGDPLIVQLVAAMRRDRHDVRGAVRKPKPGAGVGDLHHVAREIARRVIHPLLRRRNVAAGGVIVSPEMRGDGAAARGVQEAG